MSSHCTFYDKSFLDDLYAYKYNHIKNTIEYYSNGNFIGDSSEVFINEESIKKYLYGNSEQWCPAFVSRSQNGVYSMGLYNGTTPLSDNIGIEDVITIEKPQFQNWTIDGDKHRLGVDWILNSDLCPFYPQYGILFWFRYSNTKMNPMTIDDIPNNAVIKLASGSYPIKYDNDIVYLNPDVRLIKKDKNTLLLADEESVIIPNQMLLDQSIRPSAKNRYIKINDILATDAKLKRENILFVYINDNAIFNKPELSLWIPDGETYSYFKTSQDINEVYQNDMCSSSYISPALFNIYREIYNILTCTISRNADVISQNGSIQRIPKPFFEHPRESKLFKKLCHVLSTYPLLDRTTVSILYDSVADALEYISKIPKSLPDELSSLIEALTKITAPLNNLITDYKPDNQNNYSSGMINSKTDLFNRLLFKYGANLKLEEKCKLTYKNGLSYGPNVKINQEINSRCDRRISRGSVVYNNITIKAGSFVIKTEFDNSATALTLFNPLSGKEKIRIPLWDIEKTKFQNVQIPVSAGPDIDITFGKQYTDDLKEIEYEFTESAIDYNGKYDPSVLGGENPDVLWTRIFGPDCLRFGASPSQNQPLSRYETSSDAAPKIFVKSPGKYVLQLRVRTSLAIIYDTVTIHVNGDILDKKTEATIESYSRSERLRPADIQYIRPINNLAIMVPNIRECYIGKQGVFWPSYTDCSVKIPQGLANPDLPPGPGNSLPPAVIPLGNRYHKFAIDMLYKNDKKIIQNLQCPFSIEYDCHNTTILLKKIKLTHLLGNNLPNDIYSLDKNLSYNCESLYEGIIDNKGFIIDGGSDNASFSFMDPSDNDKIVDIQGLNDLTTENFPITSYGGFSANEVKSLGVEIPFHPLPGSRLPVLVKTDNLLSEPKDDSGKVQHICHDTELAFDSKIKFQKGTFHPYYGWTTEEKFKNLSSVVKFDPYNRAIQTFKGPGIHDLSNEFSDGRPKIYRSSIKLEVAPIAYDPVGEEIDMEKEDKSEQSDHITNYGYRSIGGNIDLKSLNYNDEFDVFFPTEPDGPILSDSYCNNLLSSSNYFSSYKFTRPGSLIPFKDRGKSDKRLRWNRGTASNIGNIEVKLNFLNYVNPKNLVVWLEVEACAKVAIDLNKPKKNNDGETGQESSNQGRDPWHKGSYENTYTQLSELSDPDTSSSKLKNYLYSIWNMNDNDRIDGKILDKPFAGSPKTARSPIYRIYLLNQDHISNYEYNVNLKFSDLMDLYKNANNNNINDTTLFVNNNISNKINNTIDLSPTLSANGYNDLEIANYKKIIRENNLLNNSHRFQKFIGMPLFAQDPESNLAGNSSYTTFTLCVAVMDESDIFEPYDRVAGTEQLTGFDSCITKNRSNLVQNSLCNWELILHRIEDNHGFVPGDSFGNIKYEDDNPIIPGYNYIADFSDKLHLLPPSIINAPNMYMIDGRLCRYAKENLNVPKFSPQLPLVILPLIFMLPPTLLGAVAALPGVEMAMNEQTRQIANYLNSIRLEKQKEIFNNDWYVANYEKYPMGSPDKVLISMSKDGELFYKTEASVFKYSNSKVIQKNEHQFYKLHYNSYLRNLSIFKINEINDTNFKKILFKSYIKVINSSLDDSTLERTSLTKEILDVINQIDSIKKLEPPITTENQKQLEILQEKLDKLLRQSSNIKEQLNTGDIVLSYDESQNAEEIDKNEIFIYPNSKSKITNFKELFDSIVYSQYNNLYDLSKTTESFNTLIENKKLYYINGLRAYHFFNTHRSIVELKLKDSQEIDQEKIIEIQNKIKTLLEEKIYIFPEPKTINNSDDIKILEDELFLLRYTIIPNSILHIGYVFDGNQYYTILILNDTPTGKSVSVTPEDSKRIVVLNNNQTTKGSSNIPIDLWSFDHDQSYQFDSPHIVDRSTWGVGNYGYGSNLTTQNILSEQDIKNNIIPFKDRIDYRKNSIVYPNLFTAKFNHNDNITEIKGNISSIGFNYYIENLLEKQHYTTYDDKIYIEKNLNKIAEPYFKDIANLVYLPDITTANMIEIDVNFDTDSDSLQKGNIIFNKDISVSKTYKLKNNDDYDLLNKRLTDIQTLIDELSEKIQKSSKEYILTYVYTENNGLISPREKLKEELATILNEKRLIEYTIEKINLSKDSITTIPQITIEVNEQEDKSLDIKEITNSNLYWINIDPEQGCSIDKDRTVKILKSVKYDCLNYNDKISSSIKQICLDVSMESVVPESAVDESVNNTTTFTTYELTDKGIQSIKDKYKNLTWPENNNINYEIQRKFFINLYGKERAQEVIGTYSYICPLEPSKPDIEADGEVLNKVYNIFNLDEVNELYVEFKRIPRLLRNKDLEFDLYEPNDVGALTKSIYPSPGGPIDGSLRVWKCLDPKTGQYIAPPLYYKWLNEMIFRTYFGSIDKLEFKGREQAETKDDTFWVPYDFS